MILENGPKTESCGSGIVVLSKHSSEQFIFALLQTFPQPHGCFLVFNLPIYEASAPSALYLPKTYKQVKSPTMTLNTDTKTKQESIYSARVVMYIRSHRYKCTKILNQASVSKATSGAPECVSMSEAGEDDLFGDLSSACSSQIWP